LLSPPPGRSLPNFSFRYSVPISANRLTNPIYLTSRMYPFNILNIISLITRVLRVVTRSRNFTSCCCIINSTK
jgi:hypothetical protein